MSLIKAAHKHSTHHRTELMASQCCGCFYCLAIYEPQLITEWIDWPEETPEGKENDFGTTAICPKCGIDSVIGDASEFPITKDFMKEMHECWFET